MESNDTLLTATQTGIQASDIGRFTFNGFIGDNPSITNADDIDLFALELSAGAEVNFDINASDFNLDSVLRVFDASGDELAANDDDASSLDSFINFTTATAGTFYVGVSGFSNFDYDPEIIGSGSNFNSTGGYELVIDVFNTINGTSANDVLIGTNAADIIEGLEGNDVLIGQAGADILDGGLGNDSLTGGQGNDDLDGGLGNDRLEGENGNDTIVGGSGEDNLLGGNNNDLLLGGADDDTLSGNDGRDSLLGGNGNDRLFGNNRKDTLNGGGGQDDLFGGNGNDQLFGGTDKDTLSGGNGNDTLIGENGDDLLAGNGGNDSLRGGIGRDTLVGSGGRDVLFGDAGQDVLIGGNNSDRLLGGSAVDRLIGGNGQDTLLGQAGNDILTGGAGADQFQFTNFIEGIDTVTDFAVGIDQINVSSIIAGGNFSSATPFADYIRLFQFGADTQIQIDRNGDAAGDVFRTVATLSNITASDLSSSSFVF